MAMFKTAAKRLKELQASFDVLFSRTQELIKESEKMRKRAFLVDIQREGKLNKFMFMRNGQIHVIETYGTLADDVPAWRKDLIDD